MRDHLWSRVLRTAALVMAVGVAVPASLAAQRRPGMGTGFYTTTGLLSGDVEVGSVASSTPLAEAPRLAMWVMVTAPVQRRPKRAWIVGARANVIGLAYSNSCVVLVSNGGCQNARFEERGALLGGGAFDIGRTILRAFVGPALYNVEGQGARVGASVRIDYAVPSLKGATPVLFFNRTFAGQQGGQSVALSTLGFGLRWVQKR